MLKTKNSIDIDWTKGLFIREKAELLRKEMDRNLGNSPSDVNNLDKRLTDWRNNCLLINDKLFNQRLAAEGLNYNEFTQLLNQEETALNGKVSYSEEPDWLKKFNDIISLSEKHSLNMKHTEDGLSHIFQPFLTWVQFQLELYFQKRDVQTFINKDTVIQNCLEAIATNLLQITARTIALEINVSRLLDELEGDSPEERYAFFIENKLKSREYVTSFYNEYTALTRLLTTRTVFFVDHVFDALSRFIKDKQLIEETFQLTDINLDGLKLSLGDSHQKGRSVISFLFNDGEEILYKPKPLAISNAVQQLFQWINQKGFTTPLKIYRMVDKESYAWEEIVKQSPVKSEEELERYYTRFGGLLALMYLLKGTDFHYENIIAHGEYPVIIDYETVFHNTIQDVFKDTANTRAKLEVSHSVIGTGLVPLLGFQSKDGKGLEISGMGGRKQELPFPVLQIENRGTDELRFVRKSLLLEESSNRPMINDEEIDATQYVDFVIKGFEEVTQLVNNNKDELLASGGPIQAMNNLKIRIVVRNTHYYSNFIIESSHPDYLRNALDRENIIDRVYFTPFPPTVVRSEKADLLNGDIPYFVTTPASKDLWDSRGTRIADAFEKSGMELVLNRIKHLDNESIQKQIHYIKASILSLQEDKTPDDRNEEKTLYIPEKVDQHCFLDGAINIGDRLIEQAIYGPDEKNASWIGIGMNHQGQWNVSALETGFYDGVGGIALFLGQLGIITNEDKYIKASKAALTTAIAEANISNALPSVFYGPVSLLYPIMHLGQSFQDDKPFTQTINKKQKEIIHFLEHNVEQDEVFDVLGGSAGIIHVLLSYYQKSGNYKYVDIAQKYGQHLVDRATMTPTGIAWLSAATDFKPLGGFGHGASGIASALLRLAQFTGNERFSVMGQEALAFDRSLFDKTKSNWLDHRFDKQGLCKHYWCHGSLGIGMSRLIMPGYDQDGEMKKEIQIATQNVLNHYPSHNHSLCHGDMGAVDFLLTTGISFNNEELIRAAHALTDNLLKSSDGYLSGAIQQLETPSLFLGSAGIGYQLLRIYQPDKVPSLLLLQ
ncbi:type 2 lanthipeptide synthetase LanM family protein [Halobacillus sp. MO56]